MLVDRQQAGISPPTENHYSATTVRELEPLCPSHDSEGSTTQDCESSSVTLDADSCNKLLPDLPYCDTDEE